MQAQHMHLRKSLFLCTVALMCYQLNLGYRVAPAPVCFCFQTFYVTFVVLYQPYLYVWYALVCSLFQILFFTGDDWSFT